ncbi:MAG TPA: hypothetical protein VGX25_07650 [Actinophytocola sp.]|uniref:hypothetical protein n=1 Tax=Actinophytocola sp. TaxID=1872138 RepID=UPI002DDD433A|nr:hypothetical protein [Actinophytocola sp.]HEV2779261.1 hypothetical protein [Actinophytocola sp.]
MEELSLSEARRRLHEDDDVLREAIAGRTPEELTEPHTVAGRPIGDFCDSLRDLVAHHTMWREIDLAVLVDALGGRRHWSTTARWSTRAAGARLNRAGVVGARILLVDEVLDRFDAATASLLGTLDRLDRRRWTEPVFPDDDVTLGRWIQTHFSVPGQPPFRHATFHLNGVPGSAVDPA